MLRTDFLDLRHAASLAVCLLASNTVATAAAQESGGSFGGSHFGGESHDSHSGGSSSGGSRDRGSSFGGGSSFSSDRHSSSFDRDRGSSSLGSSDVTADSLAPLTEAERAAAERRRVELVAERAAAELARLRALPPLERARAASWPDDDTWPTGSAATDWIAPPVIGRRPWAQTERVSNATSSVRESRRGPLSPFTLFFMTGWCFVPLSMLALVLGFAFDRRKGVASAPTKNGGASEVRRVSLALDWTARRAIQAELDALAARATTSSKRGLFDALITTRALLERHANAVRYAGWERVATRGPKAAEMAFRDRTYAFRARFRSELIRNGSRAVLAARVPRIDEGEGLVVVTIVVATAHALPALPFFKSRNAASAALRSVAPRDAESLWALEVIWSPAAEQDRLSSAELEVLYPELARTDGSSDVGRTICDFCEATYPAELGRCPVCGAPLSS